MNVELGLYGMHALFWGSLGVTRALLARGGGAAAEGAPATQEETTARFSRALVLFHAFGFGVLYFGIGNAVLGRRVPVWFPGQRVLGALVIALGAALVAWAFVFFRSWRFRAKLDAGHELATGGPFRLVRHPIYAGLDLLALGSAIWAPTAIVWTGFALLALGSDLRARAEERLLLAAFGEAYRAYAAKTKRFLPGIY